MRLFSVDKKVLGKFLCLLAILQVVMRLPMMAQNPTQQTKITDKDTVTAGLKPTFGTDQFYIGYVGVAYSRVRYHDGKTPYSSSHTIGINYSPFLNSLHPFYEGLLPKAVGQWDLTLKAGYDGLRRMNFFGLGNETKVVTDNDRFYWMRTRNQYAAVGLSRRFAKYHVVDLGLTYDGIQVLDDESRFVAKTSRTIDASTYDWQRFAGTRATYTFTHVNSEGFPTKGVQLSASAGYSENLSNSDRSFARYTADADIYVPLAGEFSLAVSTGAATLSGEPDFYQYNTIGGGRTLRGYPRWRFYGKTSFYNQNELRWIRYVDKGSISGHFGLLGLYDVGRVWQPGEQSDKYHFGYGAGIILAPFDKIVLTAVLAISNEDRRTHLRVSRSF